MADETPNDAPDDAPDDARYRDLMSRLLVHNEETWDALVAHGVTERTPLRLDFAFATPERASADALARVLAEETDYDVEVGPDDDGRWMVVGATQPAAVSREVLDAWAEWMVTAGLQAGCDFVGWSTSV